MTRRLKLAIVGRPNVGKSALFNRISGKRIAIVDEAEGITRDRIYADADFFGMPFQVIDTGGIDYHSSQDFIYEIKQQAEIAIEEADTLVMVVDFKVGITPLDHEIARVLLRTQKPLCLAVNKVDNPHEEFRHQFQQLGIKNIVAVSAIQGWHIAELLETAFENFNTKDLTQEEDEGTIKIAIVGRPNVGKSSLLNYLLNEERCIVSPIPGTTRDSIDVAFMHGDKKYTLIDTAGIRRKKSENEVVDKFAAMRTERAIDRADICLFVLDAQQGMTTQEKRIASQIEESGKGCVLLFNKWDLVKGFRMEHCLQGVEEEVPFLSYCPKVFISAKTGRNIDKIFDDVEKVYESTQTRINTHQLNKFVAEAIQRNHPPMIKGKRLRIYYMAQVETKPPTFVFFVNYPTLMAESFRKYLYNQFRETYNFAGMPIVFRLRGRQQEEKKDGHTHKKDVTEMDHEDLEDEFLDSNQEDAEE
jgi:GTP-binding protein